MLVFRKFQYFSDHSDLQFSSALLFSVSKLLVGNFQLIQFTLHGFEKAVKVVNQFHVKRINLLLFFLYVFVDIFILHHDLRNPVYEKKNVQESKFIRNLKNC